MNMAYTHTWNRTGNLAIGTWKVPEDTDVTLLKLLPYALLLITLAVGLPLLFAGHYVTLFGFVLAQVVCIGFARLLVKAHET